MVNTGYLQSLFYGDETQYGSAAVINKSIGLVQSISPTETNNLIKVRTLGGSRDYSNIVPGRFEISGNFEYYIQDGSFLKYAIGEAVSTAHSTTNYRHTMGAGDSPLADKFPSFTLEFADTEDDGTAADTKNLHRLYTGCRVNTLSVSGSVDEPVSVTSEFMAQGVKISTAEATSVSESAKDPFVFYQGRIYATSGSIDHNTVLTSDDAICEVNSFEFSVNNNLEAIWYISGTCAPEQTPRGLRALVAKGRDYEGNVEIHFSDRKMYQRFLGSNTATQGGFDLDKYQIVLDFVRGGAISATPTNEDDYMRIILKDVAFEENTIPGAPEDVVTQSLSLSIEKANIHVVDDIAAY